MMNPLRRAASLLLLVCMTLSPRALLAQELQPLTVEVDRDDVTSDDIITLTITVRASANIPTPQIPSFRDFFIISSGSASSISIVEGNTSAEVVHQYRLRPARIGDLTLDSVGVTVDGQRYRSEPITIHVRAGSRVLEPSSEPASNNTELTGQDYFIEAVIEKTEVYQGEQVDYIFRFYQAVPTFFQPNYTAPIFNGFWSNQQTDQRQYQVEAAGRIYQVTELRTILFPTIAGRLTIEPARLVVQGALQSPGAQMFTQPVELVVKELPIGAPDEFNGAVGNFTIEAELDDSSGVVNEPFTLKVHINGRGNINTIPDPVWPELLNWRAFNGTTTLNAQVIDNHLAGTRAYERLLVPNVVGEFDIPSIKYSFFDPETAEYHTISTSALPVTVNPGDNSEAPIPDIENPEEQVAIELLASDIRHVKPVPDSLSVARPALTTQSSYWVAWGALLALLGGSVAWQSYRARAFKDAATTRSLQARSKAMKAVAQARRDQVDPFMAAGNILCVYLTDKLNHPVLGLTHNALSDLLLARGIDAEQVERAKSCMIACEGGRFAPRGSTFNVPETLLDDTAALINELERGFNA